MKFHKIKILDFKAYLHDVVMKDAAEILIDKNVQYFIHDLPVPKRATQGSAGYDFTLPYDVVLEPHSKVLVGTGICVQLDPDKVLLMFIRSSLSKQGIELGNQVSVIDSDYYANPDNNGHIFEYLINHTDKRIILKQGTKAFQGVIVQYFVTENDSYGVGRQRIGGFGSTDVMEQVEEEIKEQEQKKIDYRIIDGVIVNEKDEVDKKWENGEVVIDETESQEEEEETVVETVKTIEDEPVSGKITVIHPEQAEQAETESEPEQIQEPISQQEVKVGSKKMKRKHK